MDSGFVYTINLFLSRNYALSGAAKFIMYQAVAKHDKSKLSAYVYFVKKDPDHLIGGIYKYIFLFVP